nr:glucose dehydrogenase [FAD, quinone]-like [Cherax quadricarinatus]
MTIGARKEVVLSAGAIRSPHLLLVSGVGPQDHLQRHEVEIVADVPGVGQNLHDHVCVHGLSWTTRKGVTSSTLWNTLNFASIKQYVNNRGGGLGDTLAGVHDAWGRCLYEGDPLSVPDIQALFLCTPVLTRHRFWYSTVHPQDATCNNQIKSWYLFTEDVRKLSFCLGPPEIKPRTFQLSLKLHLIVIAESESQHQAMPLGSLLLGSLS